MAYPSSNSNEVVAFDTDSHQIIINAGATAAFSPCLQDFTEFMPMESSVHGLGTLKTKGIGTIEYKILKDKNILATVTIHGAYYVPSLGTQLLSPQQLCQQYRAVYEGGSNYFKLQWNNHCKTIPLTKANNLPLLYTASGNSVAQSIHAHIANSESSDVLAFKMEKKIPEFNLQPNLSQEDSEEDLMATTPISPDPISSDSPKKQYPVQCTKQTCSDYNKIEINDNDNKISMSDITNIMKDQCDCLHLHERWDHMSFDLLKRLAYHGLIEKRFAKVDPPFCLSCKLGKARQLSRNKSNSII